MDRCSGPLGTNHNLQLASSGSKVTHCKNSLTLSYLFLNWSGDLPTAHRMSDEVPGCCWNLGFALGRGNCDIWTHNTVGRRDGRQADIDTELFVHLIGQGIWA